MQRAICDLGWAQNSKILEGGVCWGGGGGGGEAAIPLQLGREGGGASDIFVVLGVWTLDRASGVGAATWVSCQLWWRALLDMGHLMGGKWYWSLLCNLSREHH